ncbi:glutathione transferase [Tatumella sp. TA1]|uniref:VOC family protein n=1 Tax=Rosenbergiella collisarenosi TaxID=1544695 RepID=UPI0008F87967|nr:VOC family protein [Rosenbergiella collisarenosi]MBT0720277.1 glutathione transferase [Rosenbergiella collisarenosi]QGX91998.1 glutathione transferase [Tatumella sp. TA1]
MLTGLNHITLAVGDLSKSIDFYVNTLGFTLKARWSQGAYLLLGELWFCLSVDTVSINSDYTHYALTISGDNFDDFTQRIKDRGTVEWKVNRSEGRSFYFLDPDGHKLEIHDGDIDSRLKLCRYHPYEGMELFE